MARLELTPVRPGRNASAAATTKTLSKTIAVSVTTQGSAEPATNEVVTITENLGAYGSYTATLDGDAASLTTGMTAAAFKAALVAAGWGTTNDLTVSRAGDGLATAHVYTITFVGANAATNIGTITLTTTSIKAGVKVLKPRRMDSFALVLSNASGSTATITIYENDDSTLANGNDLTVSLADGATKVVGALTGSRYLDSSGDLVIDSTQPITVNAYRIK